MKEKQSNRIKLMFCVIGIAIMLLTTSISMVSASNVWISGTNFVSGDMVDLNGNACTGTQGNGEYFDFVTFTLKADGGTSSGSVQCYLYIVDDSPSVPGDLYDPAKNTLIYTCAAQSVAGHTTGTLFYVTFEMGWTYLNSSRWYTIELYDQGTTHVSYAQASSDGSRYYYKMSVGGGGGLVVGGVYYTFSGGTPSSSPTATPLTTPTPATDWNDANSVMSTVISLILPLAFVLIPAFLGYKFAGAWGFFAGINVGVILCYCFGAIIPLWGVIVMLVVDGLLLFGKVGFRT